MNELNNIAIRVYTWHIPSLGVILYHLDFRAPLNIALETAKYCQDDPRVPSPHIGLPA